MDEWLSLEQVRDILGLDYEALKKRIQRGKFATAIQVEGRSEDGRSIGKNGKVWQVHIKDPAIPKEYQDAWLNAQMEMVAALPAVQEQHEKMPVVANKADLPALSDLKKWQREVMDARMLFIRLIERAIATGYTLKDALLTIEKQAKEGTLPIQAQRQMEKANARKGEERTLSYDGMKKWWAVWQATKNPVALAPKDTEKLPFEVLVAWVRDYQPGKANLCCLAPGIPEWLPYLLDAYRDPQKPSEAEALRRLKRNAPASLEIPSKDQVNRILKRIPDMYKEKGRMTGAEYRAILGYAQRDASGYHPMTLCQIDGHSFKAYAAHPTTGAHFHPEVCGVICLTTKAIVGYSAGLAESWRTVADAVRHACTVNEDKLLGGVPAMLEPDRGSGNMAKVNSDEFFGIFSRLGIDFLPPEEGGNPQGHGAIERVNQSLWIRAAKALPTYTGKDMDRNVRKRIYTKLEKDLKQIKDAGQLGLVEKTSKILLSWREFLDFLDDWVHEYNNTPHSALPKITAPDPGDPNGKPRRRHMTPTERWAQSLAEGWRPTVYDGDMLEHLMMPHERITVRREKFTLHGNSYHAYELCRWHNREMIAAYDIHDAKKVWVLDLEERPICVATWNGNKRDARPVSERERAEMNRENRRTKNLENKLEMVKSEAQRNVIEVAPTHVEVPAEVLAGEERREQKVISLADSRRLRDITSPTDVYYMVLDRIKDGTVTPYQQQWRKDYEYWDETTKKIGLLKEDPYCLRDPDEQTETQEPRG